VTLTEAVILGVIQGLTELLPVSSSAHLGIIPSLWPGFHQPSVAFDVLLHLGTLLSVVYFLRRVILSLLVSLAPGQGTDGGEKTAARFSFLLSIPAIAGAVLLKSADLLRLPANDLPILIAGFLAAAVTGLCSLKLLFAMINQTGLTPFALYCRFVGAATLILRGRG